MARRWTPQVFAGGIMWGWTYVRAAEMPIEWRRVFLARASNCGCFGVSCPRHPPWWTKGIRIWTEDECLRHDPDTEHVETAWRRLFGEPLPADYLEEWDGGDCTVYLYPEGRVRWASYDGSYISLVPLHIV